jgi:hypothetical protein
MKKVTPEGQLTKSVRQLLKTLHVFHYKAWGGPMSEPGIADIIGIYRGKFLAIELKAPKGVLSDNQKVFLKRVLDEGGIAIVAKSLDDVIDGLGVRDRFLL